MPRTRIDRLPAPPEDDELLDPPPEDDELLDELPLPEELDELEELPELLDEDELLLELEEDDLLPELDELLPEELDELEALPELLEEELLLELEEEDLPPELDELLEDPPPLDEGPEPLDEEELPPAPEELLEELLLEEELELDEPELLLEPELLVEPPEPDCRAAGETAVELPQAASTSANNGAPKRNNIPFDTAPLHRRCRPGKNQNARAYPAPAGCPTSTHFTAAPVLLSTSEGRLRCSSERTSAAVERQGLASDEGAWAKNASWLLEIF